MYVHTGLRNDFSTTTEETLFRYFRGKGNSSRRSSTDGKIVDDRVIYFAP